MTQSQQAKLIAALASAFGVAGVERKARKQRTYTKNAHVDDAQDYRLRRITAIGRGFARKGIKVAFDQATGRFTNVKPYKMWLAEGRQVRKGEHGVRGFFHLSQTEPVSTETKADLQKLAAQAVALKDALDAEYGATA